MLVDPVRRQPGHDPAVPPGGRLHLLAPGHRRVPVVADVVVVEDHRARQRREQPPVGGVAPRQRVQVGVLLVVLELLAGGLADVAPRRDEVAHLLAGLVGVDLVAQEHDQVRPRQPLPGVGDAGHRQRVGAHRVDAVGGVALAVVTDAGAAGSEREPGRLALLQGADHRRWEVEVGAFGGPDPGRADGVLQGDGVRRDGARLQTLDLHQGVVVTVHGERRGRPGPFVRLHVHGAGVVGLDPDRGRGVVDVAEQRPEDEVCHRLTPRGRP